MSVRVPSTLLAVSALLLVAAPAAAAQAEPDPLPPGVIARVGEKDITKRSFDKWLKPAAHAQHGAGAVFDPPTYDRCIVRETRILSKKSETAPAREALLAQCKSRHETLIKQVAQFLIQAQWIEQAATAAKIRLTPKQVRRAFKAQKRRA
jgi:hypothetical protein